MRMPVDSINNFCKCCTRNEVLRNILEDIIANGDLFIES